MNFHSSGSIRILRGQAMAEVLLIGPLIAFLLLTAVSIGTYFYSFSVAQAMAYSNSVHYSFSGDPQRLSNPIFSSAQESITYWNQAIHQNQTVEDSCLTSREKIMSTLSVIPAGAEEKSLLPYVPFGNIVTRSLSIAFRPPFGGVDPNRYGVLCKQAQTKGIVTIPGLIQNPAPGLPVGSGAGEQSGGGL
jgi:hypothetical protein